MKNHLFKYTRIGDFFMWKKIILLVTMAVFLFPNSIIADDSNEEDVDSNEIDNEIIEVSGTVSKTPTLNSRAAIILDRNSKTVMFEKNANTRRAMASTTKIMTAIIVLENGNLSDIITVSQKAAGTGGSRLGLKKGDKVSLKDLLYGLMLRSGNDSAVAIAEHIGGSVQGFAEKMNQKAKQLGLVNTKFVTPHGLDDQEHYTTAYELALLTDYALNNKKFAELVNTKSCSISINGVSRVISNTNELLGNLAGVNGVKTGFTNGAGRCLVTSVIRNNKSLITVVLGADTKKNRTTDSIRLIEYAYQNFEYIDIDQLAKQEFQKWKEINEKRIIINKGKENTIELEMRPITNNSIPILKEQKEQVRIEIEAINYLEAPVKKGAVIGIVKVFWKEELIGQTNLVCSKQIEKKEIYDYMKQILKQYSFS